MSANDLHGDPIAFPADDEYSNPQVYRAGERFWWHQAIATELVRLAREGFAAFSVAGLAGNIRGMSDWDVRQYCRQMLAWGELVPAAALWDFEVDSWVSLATAAESAAAA